jgi:multidrug efflux pump subunit AcrA (membrane-fusion protein)
MTPRLRNDLAVSNTEEDGVACVEVTDPLTGSSFRFYDFEYALAQQLNGQPLEAVVAWAAATYGIELGSDALDTFVEKLAGLGFLADGRAGAGPAADLSPVAPAAEGPADVPGVEAFAAEIAASVVDDEAISTAVPEPAPPASVQAAVALTPDVAGAPPVPRQPERVPPRLHMLGGPLPPPAGPPAKSPSPSPWGDSDDADSTADFDAALSVLGDSSAPSGETPLAFIAHAVAVKSSGPAPVGALDTAAAPPPRAPAPTPEAAPSVSAVAAAAAAAAAVVAPSVAETQAAAPSGALGGPGSWTADVDDQIEHPRPPPERRPPQRPELVVIPPTPVPVAGEATMAVPLPRRKGGAAAVLLLLAGAAAAAVWFLRPDPEPAVAPVGASAPTVHVVSPQPTTFYRWFETIGTVSAGRDDTLSFARPGRLQDAMAPGTTFAAGEPIARLKGVGERELLVNKIRSRVAFLEQLRDISRSLGEAALRQAEAKLAAKRQELAAAQAAQAQLEIRPPVAGEIAQLLVPKGAFVAAGAPVFHVRAAGPQATFALSADDVAKARALGFCRLETIPGSAAPSADGGASEGAAGARAIDCAYAAPSGSDTSLAVGVGNASGVAPGTQVRLASARYDGVYPVPRSALVRDGEATRLWVATAAHAASSRTVEVAATIDELALVSRGLGVGDAIIIDPPLSLREGTEINVAR